MLAAFLPPLPMPVGYTTINLHLAAFLLHRGAVLLDCQRTRPKRYRFVFATDSKLHALIRTYWQGVLTPVIPSALLAMPQELKSRAMGRRRKGARVTGNADSPDVAC